MNTQTLLQEQRDEIQKYVKSLKLQIKMTGFKGCVGCGITPESIKQILQAEVEYLKTKFKREPCPEPINYPDYEYSRHYLILKQIDAYNQAITDQINRLTHIIKML